MLSACSLDGESSTEQNYIVDYATSFHFGENSWGPVMRDSGGIAIRCLFYIARRSGSNLGVTWKGYSKWIVAPGFHVNTVSLLLQQQLSNIQSCSSSLWFLYIRGDLQAPLSYVGLI